MDSLGLSRATALPKTADQSSRRPPKRPADRPKPAPRPAETAAPDADAAASSPILDVLA